MTCLVHGTKVANHGSQPDGQPAGSKLKFDAPKVGTIGNGTCGAVYVAGSCATDPVGYFEGVATMAACAAKVMACPKANYASWSSKDHSCAWYSACDMATLCADCSAVGSCAVPHNPQCPACDKSCPPGPYPHTSEVVRAVGGHLNDGTTLPNDVCLNVSPTAGGGEALELWAKKQPNGAMAVFLINNHQANSYTTTVDVSELGFKATQLLKLRDVWARTDNGTTVGGKFELTVGPRDSAMVVLSLD